MEVNGMTPKDLANFYVETAFNSRSKLKLSKYGIYGIDFPTRENLDKDIDEFNESEEEITDSQDLLSDDFEVDQNNNKKDNDDDSEDKSEEDDPDDLCPF